MALDSWLCKVRSALSSSKPAKPPSQPTKLTILAFEVATLMSRLIHLHRSLSDHHLSLLHLHTFHHPGIIHLVSPDPHSLRSLFSSELADSLRLAADAVASTLSHRCSDPALRDFRRLLSNFADGDADPNRWALGWKELEPKVRKMERLVGTTIALYRKMDEVAEKEQVLKKILAHGGRQHYHSAVAELHHKIEWQRHEVSQLKDSSLWNRSFDSVTALLARAMFSLLARMKQVFHGPGESPASRPSEVHPSEETAELDKRLAGFFESAATGAAPPPNSLGASGLALRYANIVAVIEKMVRSPRSIGPDARDDLYSMLPVTIRAALRVRLKGVEPMASDEGLAAEWREALGRILEWLGPLAWSTVRLWSERSFEKRGGGGGGGVMAVETLQFADRERAEAAVAELLVGLNYVWRFEMERSCAGANGVINCKSG